MRNKKDETTEPTPEQLLEAKVDAMMDPIAKKASVSAAVSKPQEALKPDELPPLDIFADAGTAPDVPKDLLKQIGAQEETKPVEVKKAAPTPTPLAGDVPLDDAVSDAAIDDIEAHESDETLATEDSERAEAATVTEPVERVQKLHHHPVFWTFIFLIAVIAILAAYLLITGGQ